MKITIDNSEFAVNKRETVLDVILNNGLYLPHLCSHPELTPYGGCRLCIVEIEGVRGYPTACTTYISEDMSIITKSKKLEELRKDILKLILSEHPSGCLVCEEDCSEFMGTIKKVGVTTGCRWCPSDKNCELQDVVEYVSINDTEFNVSYREFPVEKDDPFFDRDYNLCIYCGRCVRICNEFRKSSVISLKQRWKLTTIGPSFSFSHIDADCEFCGACVSVCPTGTLSEKAKKWAGPPDKYIDSFCTLCSLKCKVNVSMKNGRVVGTLPSGELHYSAGDLCVKGRFCISEIMNSPGRAIQTKIRFPEGPGVVKFGEALKKASEMIEDTPGERIAVYISPDLPVEELAAARRLSELVLKTENISSEIFTTGMIKILPLLEKGMTFNQFKSADSYISLFFNGNYGYAPATLAVKRGKKSGKSYHRIGWIKDTTSISAENDVYVQPDGYVKFLTDLITKLVKGKCGDKMVETTAEFINTKQDPVFIIGLEILDHSDCLEIISLISEILDITGSGVFIPDPYGNLRGLLNIFDLKNSSDIKKMISEGKIDLLYLIGDNPFSKRPDVKGIIYQNPFSPPGGLDPDIIFPSTLWSEASGKYTVNKDMHVKVKEFSEIRGYAKNNIEIFNEISGLSGISKKMISGKNVLKDLLSSQKLKYPKSVTGNVYAKGAEGNSNPYLLIQEKNNHSLFGKSLSKTVKGMMEIVPEDTIMLNPSDGVKLKVRTGDVIKVGITGKSSDFPVMLRRNVPAGIAYLILSTGDFILDRNPCKVRLRRG